MAVDREMRTNMPGVYAAGDICTVKWEEHKGVDTGENIRITVCSSEHYYFMETQVVELVLI